VHTQESRGPCSTAAEKRGMAEEGTEAEMARAMAEGAEEEAMGLVMVVTTVA